MRFVTNTHRGFTFVELLVTAAVVTLVFGGLMSSIQFTVRLIAKTKLTTSALSLATERIEYLRSLPYNSVGTDGGIPAGSIPQTSTTSLNGITFTERILVQYVDSPDDGIGASDDNGILADYKEAKVEYSWWTGSGTTTIFLLTNIVPPGIESTAGGGTLTVNVFDAAVQPVSGAEVRVYNDTLALIVDTTRFTNINGVAMFAGAPAGANYQITVSKTDYSTDSTRGATTTNPNPATPHVAVLESVVSTMNFQIDRLSDLTIETVEPATTGAFLDGFDDITKIFASSNTQVGGGEMTLSGAPGSYATPGIVDSIPVSPGVLEFWGQATWDADVPVSTTFSVQVYEVIGTSTYALIPDLDLPANSTGFTTSPIDLSGLDTGTYGSIALRGTMTTSDVNVTPTLREWGIGYTISEQSIGSIPFTLRGNKVIGTTASATSIYKYEGSHTTNGSGSLLLSDMEWDFYDIDLTTGAYDIQEACPALPFGLEPNVSENVKLTLVPNTVYTLRVHAVDVDGNPVSGATITLSRSGFSESEDTSPCGQVFFNSLSTATDYEIDITAAGFQDYNTTNIAIEGDQSLLVTLVAS